MQLSDARRASLAEASGGGRGPGLRVSMERSVAASRLIMNLPAFARRARGEDSGMMGEPVASFEEKRISEKFDKIR